MEEEKKEDDKAAEPTPAPVEEVKKGPIEQDLTTTENLVYVDRIIDYNEYMDRAIGYTDE